MRFLVLLNAYSVSNNESEKKLAEKGEMAVISLHRQKRREMDLKQLDAETEKLRKKMETFQKRMSRNSEHHSSILYNR